MRHELKHVITSQEHAVLASGMRAALGRDAHSGADGTYRVRSLYFDTPYDRALHEKLDGVDRRTKYRLRRYPGVGQGIALEKKTRVRGLCEKLAAPLSREEAEALLAGDVAWMAADVRPLVVEFYSRLRGCALMPKAVVDYAREAYVCRAGNVRLTFDSDIRAGRSSDAFLDDAQPLLPAAQGMVVLEVKYDAFLPAHVELLLAASGRRAQACSKYALGRAVGLDWR